MTCKNCGSQNIGKFCSECGQKSSVNRITFKYLVKEIPSSIFQINRGLFYTIKELVVRPSKTVSGYIVGKRVKLFKPFAYVVVLSTICSFISYLVSLYIRSNMSTKVVNVIQFEQADWHYYWYYARRFFTQYQSVFYFLMIPIISICSWAFFNKAYNFWENIVLNTYLTAQFNLLIILAQVIRLFNHGSISYTPFLILYFTYLGFVYAKFFNKNQRKKIFGLKVFLLMILIVLIYTTGLSLAGMMTPWWGI